MTEGILQRTNVAETQFLNENERARLVLTGQNKTRSGQGTERGRSESSSKQSTNASNTLDGIGKRLAEDFMKQMRKFEEDIKNNPQKYSRQVKPADFEAVAARWEQVAKKYDEAYNALLKDPKAKELLSDDDFNALLKELKKIRDPRIAFYPEKEKILQNLFKLFADPKYKDLLKNDKVLNFIQAAISLIQESPSKFFYDVNQALKKLDRETSNEKAQRAHKQEKPKTSR